MKTEPIGSSVSIVFRLLENLADRSCGSTMMLLLRMERRENVETIEELTRIVRGLLEPLEAIQESRRINKLGPRENGLALFDLDALVSNAKARIGK